VQRAPVGNTSGVANELRSAQQAAARGSNQEALVHLWNAVEPARLAGDARRLRVIAGIAQQVRSRGDEGEAREAERLLETLRGAVSAEGTIAPATGQLDAEVYAGGEHVDDFQAGGFRTESYQGEGEQEEAAGRGARIGNLVWIALVVAIILFNVFADRGGG
jgi:hypothetical protein